MLAYRLLAVFASATLAAAWPAVFYSDVNCTNVVAAYSQLPEETCVNTADVQSYRGSLASEKQELILFGQKEDCSNPEAYPIGVIEGAATSCVFIYKHLGPFGAAKIVPVQVPETHSNKTVKLVSQNYHGQ